jgi:hypothetical protein
MRFGRDEPVRRQLFRRLRAVRPSRGAQAAARCARCSMRKRLRTTMWS